MLDILRLIIIFWLLNNPKDIILRNFGVSRMLELIIALAHCLSMFNIFLLILVASSLLN
jgi:hypothetical protein